MSSEGDVEPGIILLHVGGAVLGAEFFDDRRYRFGVSDRSDFQFGPGVAGFDADGRVLEDVFIPLRVRTLDGQEVECVVLGNEPDRVGDGAT